MKYLTQKQSEILQYIQKFSSEKGFQPSFREIKTAFGFRSLGSVSSHIQALKTKGYLKKKEKKWRAFEVQEEENTQNLSTIPLIGSICKGKPLEMFAQPSSCIFPELQAQGTIYAFLVGDDSFQTEGLLQGDIIAIASQMDLQNGNTLLVGALQEGLTIGKYLQNETGEFFQNSSKDSPQAIQDITICGKLIALMRKF